MGERPSTRLPVLAGAVCWLLALEWFVGQAIAQAAWRTPYSLSSNFVSDLGAATCGRSTLPGYPVYVCSPLHDVMNLSFVVLGLLTLAGVVLLRGTWPQRRLTTGGLIFLALFGIGKVLVGLGPEDVRRALHAVGSLGILCGTVGIQLLGLATWRTARRQAMVSLAVGVVGLISFVLLVLGAGSHGQVGTFERLADWPLPLWLAALGPMLVRSPEPGTRPVT